MPRLLAAVLAATFVSPCAAAPELTVAASTAAASKPGAIILKVEGRTSDAPYRRPSIGLGGLFAEGKPLEATLWGGAGAIAGSLAGPAGTVIGAGAGAVCGLLYSLFVVPRNGPEPARGLPSK